MKRRVVLLPVLALLHAAVLVVVIAGAVVAAPTPEPASISSYAVAVPTVAPVEPAMTEISVPLAVAAPDIAVAAVARAPSAETGNDCALTETIRAALAGNGAVASVLATIPSKARTVANAVMLWDGQWASLPSQRGTADLRLIREVVTSSIQDAPTDCQQMRLTGPRLMMIPDSSGVVVLAFGSGNWSWAEVAG